MIFKNRKPGKAVVLIAFAAVLIWTNIRLTRMENRLSYLQDTADVVQMDVGTLQSNLEKTLKKENSILEDYSLEVGETDLEAGTYQLVVTAIPKEYTEKTKLTLYMGTKDYSMKRTGFSYSANVTLPLSESYDGNVTILITNGRKKNTEILSEYEGYPTRIGKILTGYLTGKLPHYNQGRLVYDGMAEFELSAHDVEKLQEFQSLCLIVTAADREIYKKQLLTEEFLEKNQNSFLREPEAAKESSETMTEAAGSESLSGESDGERPIGIVNGWKGKVPVTLNEEMEPGQQIRVFLQADSVDGYRLQRSLFEGILPGAKSSGKESESKPGKFRVFDGKFEYEFADSEES